jgi:hypothetical protein
MASPKPRPSAVSPEALIAGLRNEDRRTEAERVLALMTAATERTARLIDPGTIGFGESALDAAPPVAFSPRARELVFYGLLGHPRSEDLLARLGRHRLGPDRLYVKRLADVDTDVLSALVAHACERLQGASATET